MWPFVKKEVHYIDGREIIFIDKTNKSRKLYQKWVIKELQGKEYYVPVDTPRNEYILYIKNKILDLCKTSDIAAKFPSLQFILLENSNNKLGNRPQHSAWVNFTNKHPIIYLNIDDLMAIDATIIHELTHLFHFRIKNFVELRTRAISNLNKALQHNNYFPKLTKKSQIKDYFYICRLGLTFLFSKIQMEGMAEFAEVFNTDKKFSFSEERFNYYKTLAEAQADIFAINFSAFLRVFNIGDIQIGWDKFTKESEKSCYSMGLHITYSILYFDKTLNLEDLMKLGHFKLFQIYEKLMIANDQRPIITVSSNKGIIDYNSLLKSLVVSFENLNNKV